VGQVSAILVAIVIAAGTSHRQSAIVTPRGPAAQELAHALAEVARQEGVQQRVQAGVHVRDEEGRHGQQGAKVGRAVVVRAPMSPDDARLLRQVAHSEHHHYRDQHPGKQRDRDDQDTTIDRDTKSLYSSSRGTLASKIIVDWRKSRSSKRTVDYEKRKSRASRNRKREKEIYLITPRLARSTFLLDVCTW